MLFRVVSAEPASSTGTAISSAMEEIDDALAFALVLTEYELEVLRIGDAGGVTVKDADEVKVWYDAAEEARRTPASVTIELQPNRRPAS